VRAAPLGPRAAPTTRGLLCSRPVTPTALRLRAVRAQQNDAGAVRDRHRWNLVGRFATFSSRLDLGGGAGELAVAVSGCHVGAGPFVLAWLFRWSSLGWVRRRSSSFAWAPALAGRPGCARRGRRLAVAIAIFLRRERREPATLCTVRSVVARAGTARRVQESWQAICR
jgi:hypothetical protein